MSEDDDVTYEPTKDRFINAHMMCVDEFLSQFGGKPRVRLHTDGSVQVFATLKEGYAIRLDMDVENG